MEHDNVIRLIVRLNFTFSELYIMTYIYIYILIYVDMYILIYKVCVYTG